MANGMRQILLLLIPAAAAILVLSEPMARLVYERGEFDAAQTELVAEALFWFAFSLPLQRPLPAASPAPSSASSGPGSRPSISGVNLVITALAALALYGPFGVGGIVAATAIATAASVVAQAVVLRASCTGSSSAACSGARSGSTAAAALLAAVSYGVWLGLDDALGRGLVAQIVSLGVALTAGAAVYVGGDHRPARPRGRSDAATAAPRGARGLSRILLSLVHG